MNKPVVWVIIGGILLGGIGAGSYLFARQGESLPTSIAEPIRGNPTTIPTPVPVSWDDPAGFTMQYPSGLAIDKHDEDTDNYAHVELRSPSHQGSLTVWVSDLPKGIRDTASWGKVAATPSGALSFDTTLGGKSAQKVLISGEEKSVRVGIVYDGVLWVVEGRLADEQFWQPVFTMVTDSFSFKPVPTEAPSAGYRAAAESAVDEEEVLQ